MILKKTLADFGFFRYIIIHPINGFWVLKRERKTSVWSVAILAFLFLATSLASKNFTGYLFDPYFARREGILFWTVVTVLPYSLWCISSWCVTTLTDGEGGFFDIVCATVYGLTPLILTNILNLILSYVFSLNELNFYSLISTIGLIWTFSLLFFGMMVTQQYTLKKALFITALTLAGMLIILLIGFFIWLLTQQVINFFKDVYNEFMLRIRE